MKKVPLIAGHRGARGEAPENTLVGFQHALDLGIRHFELDLQLSNDGEIMVFHDLSLRRTTGVKGRLSNFCAADLQSMKASQPWSRSWLDCEIPTLNQVLVRLAGVDWMQLEIKHDSQIRLERLCQRLLNLLDSHRCHDRVIVTSFNTWVLQRIRQLCPALTTGLVTDNPELDAPRLAEETGCQWVIPNYRLISEALLQAASDRNLITSTWTVNEVEDLKRMAELGVGSIITDYPRRALRVYADLAGD